MKKFYMTMVALLCGVAAMAQDGDGLYVNDIKVDKGATSVTIPVCLKNSIYVSSISFRIDLPEGVTIKVSKGKLQNYTLNSDRADGYSVEYQKVTGLNGGQIAVFSTYPFDLNDGPIISIDAAISEEVAAVDGTYPVALTAIGYAAPKVPADEVGDFDGIEEYNDGRSYVVSGEMTKTETSFTLTIGDGTGINSINAEDSKAPVYNVAGQRVSKAQKGVYIQNGKKVAVK